MRLDRHAVRARATELFAPEKMVEGYLDVFQAAVQRARR